MPSRRLGSRTSPSRGRNPRGFNLIELLVALFIIGVIALITVGQINRAFKRAKLESIAGDLRNFAQRALTESQKSNLQIFMEIGPRASDLSTPVSLYTDVNSNSLFDSGTDTLIATYTVPKEIVFYIPAQTGVTSYYWINNPVPSSALTVDTDDASVARRLMIDFRGRTINVATGNQINGVARLAISHTEMAASSGTLRPRIEYELRISPLWNPSLTKTLY